MCQREVAAVQHLPAEGMVARDLLDQGHAFHPRAERGVRHRRDLLRDDAVRVVPGVQHEEVGGTDCLDRRDHRLGLAVGDRLDPQRRRPHRRGAVHRRAAKLDQRGMQTRTGGQLLHHIELRRDPRV
jgi:hypothetical protein